MTMIEAPTEPTSRLHAAVNALAAWDHNTASGEDIGGQPVVQSEHWDGAREVWNALQPKITEPGELDALSYRHAVIVKHERTGVTLYSGDEGDWRLIMRDNEPKTGHVWLTSRAVLAEHGSVRLLWEQQ